MHKRVNILCVKRSNRFAQVNRVSTVLYSNILPKSLCISDAFRDTSSEE